MDHGVPTPTGDQPSIDRERRDARHEQGESQTSPEQRFVKSRVHGAWYGQHHGVVDDSMIVIETVSAAKARPSTLPSAIPLLMSGIMVSA